MKLLITPLASLLLLTLPLVLGGCGEAQAEVAETLVLQVDGMTCENCQGAVCEALESQDGVVEAKVDLESGRAEVGIAAGSEATLVSLQQAVQETGYDCSFELTAE